MNSSADRSRRLDTGSLQALAARHGGSLFVQYGHNPARPQKPPRLFWLMFDQPRHPHPNFIRNASCIARSWAMTLRLHENPRHRRTLDCLSMTYVLKGRGRFLDPAGEHDVHAGDVLLLFPGTPHAYGPPDGERWDEINVSFGGPVFESWQRPDMLDPARPVRRLEPVDYWRQRFLQVLLPMAGAGNIQTPKDWGRLVELIAEMCTAWQRPPLNADTVWLERARHCLCGLPTAHDVNWHAVARDLGVSERGFRRKFKLLAGMTPGQFCSRHRIEQARRLLLESDAKVADIALALRFVNEFHFSRRFKQLTGLSPRAYRESHRNR